MLRWLFGFRANRHPPVRTEPERLSEPSRGAGTLEPAADSPAVQPGLAHHALSPTGNGVGDRVRELAQAESPELATVKLIAQPSSTTPTSITYRLGGPEGFRLRAGEQILLEVPRELRGRAVYQAILEHHQVESEKSSELTGETKKWDHTPGITALHFHSTAEGEAGGWRYWHAPWGSSGVQGGKYAELREDWEAESHFDFAKNGTVAVEGGERIHQPITIDALRLRGVGTDPTFIRQVLVTFAPPKADRVDEHVFTPGTRIGDLLTTKGQKFGKDYDAGTFPGALVLFEGSDGGEGRAQLPPSWSYAQGELFVPLAPGLVFSGVEIACGDTKPDGLFNSDGAVGTQGHSKLRVGVLRAGAKSPEWFIEDHGVPPQGVIFGGPRRELKTQAGDQLVFGASVDPTYVMALRLSYRKPE